MQEGKNVQYVDKVSSHWQYRIQLDLIRTMQEGKNVQYVDKVSSHWQYRNMTRPNKDHAGGQKCAVCRQGH